jgi:hypothetical protein
MGLPRMDPDWYLDHESPAPNRRLRRRKNVIRMTRPRQRWRMTLDELCYAAKITPVQFDQWASAGLLGSRLQSLPAQGGRGRHIARDTAQRTVLVARLVAVGVHPEVAGCVAAGHKTGETGPLQATLPNGVTITVPRDDLP